MPFFSAASERKKIEQHLAALPCDREDVWMTTEVKTNFNVNIPRVAVTNNFMA